MQNNANSIATNIMTATGGRLLEQLSPPQPAESFT
jgi:hypothetical protein